jgi:exodeoxyribonuclease VII large subunit
MQGPSSVLTIVEAFEKAENHPEIDVVILLRGGGAKEDLSSFNAEEIVRAIASFSKPIITAIGHEIDTSLADLASDLRMATPTDAANHLGHHYRRLFEGITYLIKEMGSILTRRLNNEKTILLNHVKNARQLCLNNHGHFTQKNHHLLKRIELSNPLHKLHQGYTIIRRKSDKKIVKSKEQLSAGEIIQIQFFNSHSEATINP